MGAWTQGTSMKWFKSIKVTNPWKENNEKEKPNGLSRPWLLWCGGCLLRRGSVPPRTRSRYGLGGTPGFLPRAEVAAGDLSKISLAPNWPPIHSAAAALPAWGDPWGAGASPGAAQAGSVPRPGVAGSGARTGAGGRRGRPRPRAAAASCPGCTAAQPCLAAPALRPTRTGVRHRAADR